MSEEYKNEDVSSEVDEQVVDTVESPEGDEDQSGDGASKDELTPREKQFLARAKKAEDKNKKLKEAFEEPQAEIKKETNEPTNLSVSEQVQREVFLTTGGGKEDLEFLDTLVGDSLAEKKESMAYKLYLENKQNKEREEKASLGTSRGGQRQVTRKQTREEHKAEHEKWLKEKGY